jgi:hypothetical protein
MAILLVVFDLLVEVPKVSKVPKMPKVKAFYLSKKKMDYAAGVSLIPLKAGITLDHFKL